MKRFTACVIDTAAKTECPFYYFNEYDRTCYSEEKTEHVISKLKEITSTKYRFGYMYDELCDGYRKTLGHISHVVTSVWTEGTKVYASILVLDTPEGKVLESLLNAGMEFGFFYYFNSYGFTSIDVKVINDPTTCKKDYILSCKDSKENLV